MLFRSKEAHKQGEQCSKLVDEENEASLIRFVQMAINQDNPTTHFAQPPTYCKQYSDQDEDDEKDLQLVAKDTERAWRRKHPEYKGNPVQVEQLTKLSIQRRKYQVTVTSKKPGNKKK